MTVRLAGALGIGLATVLAAGCGKKGSPLPPLRPVPARIADLSAHRVDDRIELQFTIPNANADGSSPLAITRVEIFRMPVFPGAQAASPAQMLADSKNLHAEIPVRRVIAGAPPLAGKVELPPVPGERTTFVDRIDATQARGATAWRYVAVGTAGRGRRGVTSAVVTVPIGSPPAPPEAISFAETESALTLTWKPAAAGQTFNVFGVTRTGSPETATLLTPKPLTAATFSLPVEFGRERCFAVVPIVVTGATTVDGARSAAACITPADRYPPAAPTDLTAALDNGAVVLTWSAVTSSDLAGYVVLRGDATGIDLRPLVRQPIKETTFRDAAVQPGATYTYSVYAADNAPTPNVSQQSNRQVVTVR